MGLIRKIKRKPVRKVKAAMIAAAISGPLIAAFGYWGLDLDDEQARALANAIALLVVSGIPVVTAWKTRQSEDDIEPTDVVE